MRCDRKRAVRFGRTIAQAFLAAALWTAESRADSSDDDKRACVASADEGQLLRDGGKYSLALPQFKSCADDRCPAVVRSQCGLWLRQLIDATPTMVFAATDTQGRDLADVRVVVDSHPLAEELDGRPIAFDPGQHEIRFEARGHEAAVTIVVIHAGDKNRLVSATLRDLRALGNSPIVHASFWDGRAVTSLALLVAGVLSAGAGVSFALVSQNERDRANTLRQTVGRSGCAQPGDANCAQLSDTVDAQSRDAAVSMGFYVAAGALAAAATVAWVVWPRRANKNVGLAGLSWSPLLGPERAGLLVQGTLE